MKIGDELRASARRGSWRCAQLERSRLSADVRDHVITGLCRCPDAKGAAVFQSRWPAQAGHDAINVPIASSPQEGAFGPFSPQLFTYPRCAIVT